MSGALARCPSHDDRHRGVCDPQTSEREAVDRSNSTLAALTAPERVVWALDHLPDNAVLSSSFGIQAAVSLHMVSTVRPDIPVIFVDTGYLFAETYRFVDQLTERLNLDLRVYRPRMSGAWQEARHGQRWEDGVTGLEAYNRDNKVEPMERALRELGAQTWIAGLRRDQSDSRRATPFVQMSAGRWKVHPIADWTDRDVYRYLREHDLPYHPLWDQGYVSVGDVHSTRSLHEVDDVEATRFFGLKRECGIHEIDLGTLGDA